jgi:hypothetical protein
MLELDYTNNTAMTGVIPPQIGFLPVLQKTSILGTGMSCAGHFEPSCESVNTSCTGVHRWVSVRVLCNNSTQHNRSADGQVMVR